MFVSTQRKGIPPAHKPGDEEYTAIPLKDGEGLAYPNIILYSPTTHVLYVESNRLGVSDKSICDFFQEHAKRLNIIDFRLELACVLKTEAYERVKKMISINSIIFKVANPIQLFAHQYGTGPLEQIGDLSKDMNATKTIEIKLSSEELEGGLNKKTVLEMFKFFGKIVNLPGFNNKKNKLEVKGILSSDGNPLIEDSVNFLLDRLSDKFKLEEPIVASHPQFLERKRGISDVYVKNEPQIRKLLASFKTQ